MNYRRLFTVSGIVNGLCGAGAVYAETFWNGLPDLRFIISMHGVACLFSWIIVAFASIESEDTKQRQNSRW